jgi:hypothetical protein
METLRITKRAENGKIEIEVPESLNSKELQITVSEVNEDIKKFRDLPAEERLKILQQYKGTAKYPDAETNKYDV